MLKLETLFMKWSQQFVAGLDQTHNCSPRSTQSEGHSWVDVVGWLETFEFAGLCLPQLQYGIQSEQHNISRQYLLRRKSQEVLYGQSQKKWLKIVT